MPRLRDLDAVGADYATTGPNHTTLRSTCELGWHYAYEWAGPAERVLGRLFGAAFALGARRDLEKLARLIQSDDW